MPTQSAAEWQTLVERTSNSLLRYGCRSPPDLHDEDSFVRVFTNHCRSQKIVNYGRLLATLQFSRACGFTAVIDRQRTQVTGEALSTVVVRTCFATIQCAVARGVSIAEIVATLALLNSAVPQLKRYPTGPFSFQSLIDILTTYLDSLLLIIEHLLDAEPAPDVLHGVDTKVAAAAATLSRLGNELFDTMQSHSESGSHSGPHGTLLRSQSQDTSLDEVFMEEIGSGGFAQVWRVRQKSSPFIHYARKIVRLANRTDSEKEHLRQMIRGEHETMSKLSHDHIARVTNIREDLESQTLNIYMHPVADMNLQTYMDRCETNSFPDEDLELMKPWFACLLGALQYAHRRNVCHCDIKPANILVYRPDSAQPNICLTDFGLARDFTGMEHSRTTNLRVEGTRIYLAPEARPGVERGRMADVFSLGCVFSEMLTVWSKASNAAFAQARITEGESDFGVPDFRSHLQRVHMWLSDRQTAVWQDIAFRILTTATMSMVELDPARRWDIQRALSSLRAASDIMNCHCHSSI